jgi:hypothetical protein
MKTVISNWLQFRSQLETAIWELKKKTPKEHIFKMCNCPLGVKIIIIKKKKKNNKAININLLLGE